MKSKWNKKQLILMGIWYVAYMATLEFFRFRFGLLQISAFYLLVGVPLVWLFSRPKNSKPS
jgi:hypothetical protein